MEAHREGVWTGHDTRPCPQPPNPRRLAVEGLGLAAGATLLAFLAAPFGLALPVAAVVLGFGTFGLMGRHADERKNREIEPVEQLREEFGVGPVWMVELFVRQGEVPTGCDRGLLWVEGGRIVFTGLRTSFALAPAQAVGSVRHEPRVSGLRLRLNLRLARETVVGPLSLSFWPLSGGYGRAENDAADLRYALNRALDYGESTPADHHGQWPPIDLGPGAPRPGALLRRALLPHVGWTLAAGVVGLVGLSFAPWIGAVAFGFLAVGANFSIRGENEVRWRAWREARLAWGQG